MSSTDVSSFLPLSPNSVLPSTKLNVAGEDVDLYEFFQTRSGVLFGMPGAFNPVCTTQHAPGVRDYANEFLKKVDFVGCVLVNDPYVVKAWAKKLKIFDSVVFIADTDAAFAGRLGMLTDASHLGLGRFARCRRFGMIISKGARIEWIGYDDDAMALSVLEKMKELEKNGVLTGPSTEKECSSPDSLATTIASENRAVKTKKVNARTLISSSRIVPGVPTMNLVIDYVSSTTAEYYTKKSVTYGLQLLSTNPDSCGVIVDGCRFNFVKILFVTTPLTHAIEPPTPPECDQETDQQSTDKAPTATTDDSSSNDSVTKPSDIELHLVHRNQNDDVVVVVLRYNCSDEACNRYLGNVMRDVAMRKDQRSHERSTINGSSPKLTGLSLSWLFRYHTSDTYTFLRYISNKGQPDYKEKNVIWFVEIGERLASADQVSFFESLPKRPLKQSVYEPHSAYKVEASFTNFLI